MGRFRDSVVLALAAVLLGSGCRDVDVREPALPVGTELGERAPQLAGVRGDGSRFELQPQRAAGTAVVIYRGFHCGLCRERLRELEANRGEYERAGAQVVAVTADGPDDVGRAVTDLGLSFPVVSVDSAELRQWGVLPEQALPLPASYLLDRRGVIVFRHVGRNAADRASDLELLTVLQQMQR